MRPAPPERRLTSFERPVIVPPLLSFRGVVKHASNGLERVPLLAGISFELERGGCAGLFGRARTGKSTVLRLACGLVLPDRGVVRLGGRDIASLSIRERTRLFAREVGLVTEQVLPPVAGEPVLDHVAATLGAVGLSLRQARHSALVALDRLGVARCAQEGWHDLSHAQRACVQLASALARRPSLLLVDEPLPTPKPSERERFCALLREVAAENGIALLVASEDLSVLQGVQVLMSISDGHLSSTVHEAAIVPLPARRAMRGA
jgi:putative ABC transport system ATP-binding protein